MNESSSSSSSDNNFNDSGDGEKLKDIEPTIDQPSNGQSPNGLPSNGQSTNDPLQIKKDAKKKIKVSLITHASDSGDGTFLDRFVDFAAGAVGGTAQVIVAMPFDTVKVKQQTFPLMYKSMIDCFLSTYNNEGLIRGLYAGTTPALMATVGEYSVLFTALGSCRQFVTKLFGLQEPKDLPIVGEALAGGFASFFSTFVLCPTELIKCKLQSINEVRLLTTAERNRELPKMTMGKLIRNIYVSEGIRGFYRGLTPTFVREVPGYFSFFGCYECIREFFRQPEQSRDDVGYLVTIFAGSMSGAALWLTTFPADVIKSRIQINDLRTNMFTLGVEIAQKEGISALYRGLLPSLMRTMPASAVLLVVVGFVKKNLQNIFDI